MSKLIFPSWRYHKTLGSKIIHSEDEHHSHKKDGWVESPAHFEEKPIEVLAEEAKTKALVETKPETVETADAGMTDAGVLTDEEVEAAVDSKNNKGKKGKK